jgi:hypothetical protein
VREFIPPPFRTVPSERFVVCKYMLLFPSLPGAGRPRTLVLGASWSSQWLLGPICCGYGGITVLAVELYGGVGFQHQLRGLD